MKKYVNYGAKLNSMSRAMINEMWDIIEKRAETDDRYDAPKRFRERIFNKGEEFCEVEISGREYGVQGIRVEEGFNGSRHVSIEAEDCNQYSGLDISNICTLLIALRRQRQCKAEWKRVQKKLEEMKVKTLKD